MQGDFADSGDGGVAGDFGGEDRDFAGAVGEAETFRIAFRNRGGVENERRNGHFVGERDGGAGAGDSGDLRDAGFSVAGPEGLLPGAGHLLADQEIAGAGHVEFVGGVFGTERIIRAGEVVKRAGVVGFEHRQRGKRKSSLMGGRLAHDEVDVAGLAGDRFDVGVDIVSPFKKVVQVIRVSEIAFAVLEDATGDYDGPAFVGRQFDGFGEGGEHVGVNLGAFFQRAVGGAAEAGGEGEGAERLFGFVGAGGQGVGERFHGGFAAISGTLSEPGDEGKKAG